MRDATAARHPAHSKCASSQFRILPEDARGHPFRSRQEQRRLREIRPIRFHLVTAGIEIAPREDVWKSVKA